MEQEAHKSKKTAVLISREQLVNTATISRYFSKVKLAAKEKPLFITDNGAVDLVFLSYEAYEQMYSRLCELEEEVLQYRSEEAEREPESLVDWRSVHAVNSTTYGTTVCG